MRAGDVRTVLAHRLHRPHGSATDWPYYRAIELAMLGIARRYGVTFPTADSFSMIELGVADGTSFEQMLRFRDVLQRVIGVRQPVTCVGFDTFEGLPAERAEDEAVPWAEGDFAASVEQVRHRLEGFDGFELAQGLFADPLPEWRERLEREPPIFISVDCDYYSSTMDAFDVLMPLAPTGCLVYLDDVAAYYWSDKAGELKAVREVNDGRYGEHISLAEYPLHVETGQARHFRQLWRVVNLEKGGFPSGSY